MRGGAGTGSAAGFIKLLAPIGGYAEGPESLLNYEDFSNEGPGGWNFFFQEERNLFPQKKESAMAIKRVPGPGEPGFKCIKQKNLVPIKKLHKRK